MRRRSRGAAVGLLAAVLAGACRGGGSGSSTGEGPGARFYEEWTCSACHGADRKGTDNGPSLADVARHWTVDSLADYLRDPQSKVAADPRLGAYRKVFRDLPMPSFGHQPEAARRDLARWLLTRPSSSSPSPL